MHQLQFTNAEQTQLARLGTLAVILFGSQVQGIANSNSDYDIGVIVSPQTIETARKQIYATLFDLLSEKINALVDIDIVFLDRASTELAVHTAKYGIPLFQTDPHVFPNFKEQIMNTAADFAPLQEIFSNATLARI